MLRAAFAYDPNTFSPLLAESSYELDLERLVFDPLVTYDADGRHALPILAQRVPTIENGDVAPDGKRITFHLRHGVRWTDGAPFSSADVAFTWRAIVNPHNTALFRDGYDRVTRVETPDPYTVTFKFAKPYPAAAGTIFVDGVWIYGILPAHLLARAPSIDRLDFFSAHPVGTGQYMLTRWLRGDRMEFTANPHYFLGAPKIHRIVVSFVTGESTELLQLQSGLIDWWYQLPTDAVKSAAAIPGIRVVPSTQNRYVALTFNTARAPFDQIDARRAVAAAIDRSRIVADAAHGTGIPAIADLAPIVFHYPRDLTAHPYDPAAARAYVAKHPMHVTLVYENTTDFGNVALLVQQQLRQAGMDVSLRSIPSQLFYAAPESGGIVRGGNFDLALTTWDSGMDPDNSSIFRCASRPPYGWNLSRYCSAQMDRLQNEALSHADPRIRMPVYASIERLVVADLPQLFLYWPLRYNAITTRLKNFAPNEVVTTQNAYQWELSP